MSLYLAPIVHISLYVQLTGGSGHLNSHRTVYRNLHSIQVLIQFVIHFFQRCKYTASVDIQKRSIKN